MPPRRPRPPIVTIATMALIVIVHLLVMDRSLSLDPSSGPRLERNWVYLSPWNIWSGGYWSLLTAPLLHWNFTVPPSRIVFLSFLHLFLDLIGLWFFGRRVESVLGATPTFALLFFGTLAGSACSLAVGVWPSVGVSPAICALIGLMLASRRRTFVFGEMFLLPQHVRFTLGWLVSLTAGSLAGFFMVDNAGHLGGWLVGWLSGHLFLVPRRRPAAALGLAALAGIVVISITWLPWAPAWQQWRFLRLVDAGRGAEAFASIQPLLDKPDADALNLVAWTLATSRNDDFRDGERAIVLARMACALSEWRIPNYIDTLAAAYAEAGQWEDARNIQEQAVRTAAADPEHAPLREVLEENLRRIVGREPIRE
jgi:membrane associated rhomboid family serine protease